MPGLELSDHQGVREPVEIVSDRGVGYAEGSGEFRCVPDLSVIVGQHVPESAHARRADSHTQLGEVAWQ